MSEQKQDFLPSNLKDFTFMLSEGNLMYLPLVAQGEIHYLGQGENPDPRVFMVIHRTRKEETLATYLERIHKSKIITTDCALFSQLLCHAEDELAGQKQDIFIFTIGLRTNPTLKYFCPAQEQLMKPLQLSTCPSKGMWVKPVKPIKPVKPNNKDKYIGMTSQGPQVWNEKEWHAYLTQSVTSWSKNASRYRGLPTRDQTVKSIVECILAINQGHIEWIMT